MGAGIGVTGMIGLTLVTADFLDVTSRVMPNKDITYQMYARLLDSRVYLRSLAVAGLSQEEKLSFIKRIQEDMESYEALNKEYLSVPFVPGEEEVYQPLSTEWLKFRSKAFKAIELASSKEADAQERLFKLLIGEMPKVVKSYDEAFQVFMNFHRQDAKESVERAVATGSRIDWMIAFILLMGLGLGFAMGYSIANSIVKNVSEVVTNLSRSAETISSASAQVAASSSSLSQATTEQAASLQQTAASVAEMTAMVSRNAESARKSNEVSNLSKVKAEKGQKTVEQMVLSMEEINESNTAILNQITQSNAEILQIVKVIHEIGDRTKVINDIVFQTKLLSFNASVEAARAGEHGKGFAVVAEEVGSLAQMSGTAAREISALLQGSIDKVERIVSDMKNRVQHLVDQGRIKVESGSKIAQQCADILNEIVTNVHSATGMIADISAATEEQAAGIREINHAVGQLDQVTQMNSSTSAQGAAAARDLSDQAHALTLLVQELNQVVIGQAKPMPPSLHSESASLEPKPHLKILRFGSEPKEGEKFEDSNRQSLKWQA